ncbi:MAG TPA: polysaccharide deacetylase family protein [Opitutaceae bacterium]|nr:polysaccharide deacetylase family protein [Opitutaceae bacterium]
MARPDAKAFLWPGGRLAAVSLSWDDARASQVDVGIPILDRHGIKGTFYVLPASLRLRIAKWRAAAAAGHEIGNHTVYHPCTGNFSWQTPRTMLENYTLERMEAELLLANKLIGAALGVIPTSFAYCCNQAFVGRGARAKSYVPLVARHFTAGRTGFSEVHNRPDRCDPAQLCATDLDGKTFGEVRTEIEAAAAEGRWIIFAGHEVGRRGVRQTTSADMLDRLCAYLAGRPEIWADTISAIGRHVRATAKHPGMAIRRR